MPALIHRTSPFVLPVQKEKRSRVNPPLRSIVNRLAFNA